MSKMIELKVRVIEILDRAQDIENYIEQANTADGAIRTFILHLAERENEQLINDCNALKDEIQQETNKNIFTK